MSVSVPFPGKADMSRAGYFTTHSAEISPDGICERHLDRAVFKTDTHRISQFFFGAASEIDALDFVSAKALCGAFGKLPAETGAIYAAASNRR